MRRLLTWCAVCLIGCSAEPDALPPHGQALIVVDTNLPVPHVVSRLRIDLYDASGRWFESRDIARPDPRDWPVSFSVYTDDPSASTRVWVRLRVYPEARVRDYRGERFWDWTDPLGVEPDPTSGPRLVMDGVDRSPATEPLPLVTVDRLVLVRLVPGRTGIVDVLLDGACAGTMVQLGAAPEAGPVLGEAASCVATEKTREPVGERTAEDRASNASVVGSWGFEPCGQSTDTELVCIPGGAAILGSSELTLVPEPNLEPLPERLVRMRSFLIDRHEVTVGRFRAAIAAGFQPPSAPTVNDGPVGVTVDASCSYTSAVAEREDFGLSCIDWLSARELCKFLGGDLPTEAQWEYAATTAGQRGRTRFSWGDEPPSCERAVYGRLALAGSPGACQELGLGPVSTLAAPGDATPEGIVGLAGGLAEWTLDRAAPYADDCWRDSPLVDPSCAATTAPERILRGGSWPAPPSVLRSAVRFAVGATGRASFIGLRCVYGATP